MITAEQVLSKLEQQPYMTATELSAALGCKMPAAYAVLHSLRGTGKLVRRKRHGHDRMPYGRPWEYAVKHQ